VFKAWTWHMANRCGGQLGNNKLNKMPHSKEWFKKNWKNIYKFLNLGGMQKSKDSNKGYGDDDDCVIKEDDDGCLTSSFYSSCNLIYGMFHVPLMFSCLMVDHGVMFV